MWHVGIEALFRAGGVAGWWGWCGIGAAHFLSSMVLLVGVLRDDEGDGDAFWRRRWSVYMDAECGCKML